MAGLVAAALAGGLAGAGDAAQRGLGEMQRQQGALDLEELRNELAAKRETAIERLRQSGRLNEIDYTDKVARDRAIWGATGEGGKAARQAEADKREDELKFKTRPDVLQGVTATTAAQERGKAHTLSPGQQLLIGGEVAGENKRATSQEVQDRLYRDMLKGKGAGGGSGSGAKLDPMFKEQWDTLEKEAHQASNSARESEKSYRQDRREILKDATMDDKTRRERLDALDAEYEGERASITRRMAQVRLEQTRLRIKAGDIKPDEIVARISEGAKDPESVQQAISEAMRLDPNFGKAVQAGLSSVMQSLQAQRAGQKRVEDRGYNPLIPQDMGETGKSGPVAPAGLVQQTNHPRTGKPYGGDMINPRTGRPW